MDTVKHNLHTLFEQLGLPADKAAIEQFIKDHRLEQGALIEEAAFWNAGQAQFLRESRTSDADWAVMVDELDALLRY